MLRYEEEKNIQLAACCAFALRDTVAAKQLIPRLLATEDKFYWVYAGRLMVVVGDIVNAERLIQASKHAGVGDTAGQIATTIPGKTLARRLMHEYADAGYKYSAGYLAAELGDKEVGERVLREIAVEIEAEGMYANLNYDFIIELVKYAPDVGKRLIQLCEVAKQELSPAGQMAAILGDTATAQGYIEAFKSAGRYQSAARIAARAGDGATTAEMIWKMKEQGKDWTHDINYIVYALAHHNIEAAVEIITRLDKQGHDFGGWAAGVLAFLESLER